MGSVANSLDGVHIHVNGGEELVSGFIKEIVSKAPEQSHITSIHSEEVPFRKYDAFSIIDSVTRGIPDLLITPDFAICEDCQKELLNPEDRRYSYSYITCTKCGPRFSVETDLPYDRDRTSMEIFKMCDSCEAEYEDPLDRRFYSQTNTCPNCLVTHWVEDGSGKRLDLGQGEAVDFICKKIVEGEIVAIKGIGGFLLMCDAVNASAVKELRRKKERPQKPFALMFPDEESVKQRFKISDKELAELSNTQAPVVLLQPYKSSEYENLIELHAPGLDRLGVMLPYTPLFLLILRKLDRPLLATSGNLRGSPITFQNKKALEALSPFASQLLLNDRDIQIPQDDSVVKFSQKHLQKIIIRRSRGYAPGFIQKGVKAGFDKKVLAMGALLKSTFSIWQNGRCHVSQFLGDTTELDAQLSYERSLNHFIRLLHFTPDEIIVDKHPTYFSTHLGKEYARDLEMKVKSIQHHEAHLWAVLGENDLIESKEEILGVVFDGTGMGHDGAIWGSEFFICHNGMIDRLGHLQYYPHILGDKMAQEPRLSAMSILHASECQQKLDPKLFSEQELDFYSKVLDHASLSTSSMGRLFDAVASLLNLCHYNTYEGEAAMYLEKVAREYCSKEQIYPEGYGYKIFDSGSINLCDTIESIIENYQSGIDVGMIAARFHKTVVDVIEEIASNNGVKQIAFSGGVMQNGLLVDMIIAQLGERFKLYFHEALSPNDECISYGQLVGYYVSEQIINKEKIQTKTFA